MTYVPDPDTIEIVAASLCSATPDGPGHPSAPEHRSTAVVVLARLAAAGRLLPTGGEDRTEFAHKPGLLVHSHRCPDSALTRTVTKWPDGNEWRGPWVAVDEGSATA